MSACLTPVGVTRELICFGEDWGRHPGSAEFLTRQLLESFRVIWVNSLGWRAPRLCRSDVARAFSKMRAAATVERPHPNLVVFHPLVIPWYRMRAVRQLNARMLHTAVCTLARRQGFSRHALMTTYPAAADLFHRMSGMRRIYYCADEYTAFPGLQPELVRALEARLLAAVDVVVTTSRALYEAKSAMHSHVVYLPHGVDAEHFAKAADPSTPLPDDLVPLARPIVGFIGLIADWVDLALVRALALARPSWSIVMIGRVATDLAPVRDLPNVHLLGHQPYASLPGYCRGFDVAIIPFLTNALTERVNPVKLREYLATGKPVVSTPMPEVRQFEDLVHIAGSAEAFIQKIECSLREDPSLPSRRMAHVRHQTWAARATELAALM